MSDIQANDVDAPIPVPVWIEEHEDGTATVTTDKKETLEVTLTEGDAMP